MAPVELTRAVGLAPSNGHRPGLAASVRPAPHVVGPVGWVRTRRSLQRPALVDRLPRRRPLQQPPPAAPTADVVQADAAAVAADALAKIRALAGNKQGTDRTPEQRAAVAAQVARLAALGTPGPPPAPGSRWVTLYTTASGPAAGALGPLHGRTRQIIDASGTPTFVNTLDVFGLRATTDGAWSVRRPDRLDLTFGSTEFAFLGGLIKQRKVYDPPLKGHYRLIYGDSRLRVFETNKLSVFVLVADE